MPTNSTIPLSHADIQHIARSLKRADVFNKYSRGTVKRSTMAMINYYMRLAGHNFGNPHNLHSVM